jgi:hypothetical protein
MTKQQIIDAVLECAGTLGHTPSHIELTEHTPVSRKQVRWHFGTYASLLAECDLAGTGSGYRVEMDELFRDWAKIVRTRKKLPTIAEYELASKYSVRPLVTRFGSWRQAPLGLKKHAEARGWTEEWKDVLEIAGVQGPFDLEGAIKSAGVEGLDHVKKGRERRAVYGAPMKPYPLVCGPVNEQGVIFLFGVMAEQLGFVVLRIQTEFPDCEALMQVEEGKWERVRIEFEFESRNFLKHMHEVSGCDLIICWKHNWPECPVDVVELRTAVS